MDDQTDYVWQRDNWLNKTYIRQINDYAKDHKQRRFSVKISSLLAFRVGWYFLLHASLFFSSPKHFCTQDPYGSQVSWFFDVPSLLHWCRHFLGWCQFRSLLRFRVWVGLKLRLSVNFRFLAVWDIVCISESDASSTTKLLSYLSFSLCDSPEDCSKWMTES